MLPRLRPLAAVALLAALAGCDVSEYVTVAEPDVQTLTPSAESDAEPAGDGGGALAVLRTLEVKGRAAMTGYDRAMYGHAWMDTDRNGCDTRNDMLAAQLYDLVVEPNGCVVTAGVLDDPYTATRIDFYRGHGTLVDIDHVVSLSNAWVTGAAYWTMQQRAAFANDPLNLLAVDAHANRQKSDGDAATWLPSNKAYRCEFVARQVAVKHKYALWVTPPEAAAIERILGACPDQPLIHDTTAHPTVTDHRVPEPGQ